VGVSPVEGVIRVVLADDQSMVRAAFRAFLDVEPDIEVVGAAADGEQALGVVRQLRPDVVVMDIRMPVMDGLEATAAITADPDLADTKVLVLTTFELDEYVFGALRAGASGFLLKSGNPADLPLGVRVIAAGDALLAPSVTRRLIQEFIRRPHPVLGRQVGQPVAGVAQLTRRDREVLALVGAGLNNTEIAYELGIGAPSVRTYIARLRAKVGARDRVQLVMLAHQHHLLSD